MHTEGPGLPVAPCGAQTSRTPLLSWGVMRRKSADWYGVDASLCEHKNIFNSICKNCTIFNLEFL